MCTFGNVPRDQGDSDGTSATDEAVRRCIGTRSPFFECNE